MTHSSARAACSDSSCAGSTTLAISTWPGSSLIKPLCAKLARVTTGNRSESLVTDDVVRGHTISGTAAQARTRLAAYRDIGLDEIVIAGPTEPGDIRNTLEQLGQK